ncbi:MAG: response regulator [Pirellulales bacterium]|nr:response regulator [Pirellulales bacterium]
MLNVIPQVLISDDDLEFRETLRGILEPEGLQTHLAEDGCEAVEMVCRLNVHVVLLDIHMPKLSGLDVLRQVREAGVPAPCILMSAQLDDDLIRQANSLHAFSVLPKNAGLRQFKGIVAQALQDFYGWQQERSA